MDPNRWTQKTISALNAAQQLAQDHSHQQITPLHLAIVLFEDAEGISRQAVLRVSNEETVKSILRVLKKQMVRLPSVEPPPDQAELSSSLRKVLQHASKLQKESDDSFVGVDTLLRAVLDSKEVLTALEEAGTCATAQSVQEAEASVLVLHLVVSVSLQHDRAALSPSDLFHCLLTTRSCETGTSRKQVEGALKDMRGKDTVIDSQTGDEQFEALQKYGQDLTAQAAHLDPVGNCSALESRI